MLGFYWGYIGIMEKKMEATVVYWGYLGIMEKKMEAAVIYWRYIGIMENKMETVGTRHTRYSGVQTLEQFFGKLPVRPSCFIWRPPALQNPVKVWPVALANEGMSSWSASQKNLQIASRYVTPAGVNNTPLGEKSDKIRISKGHSLQGLPAVAFESEEGSSFNRIGKAIFLNREPSRS